jgi:transglutaminase-like putative cysteine protease
VKFLFIFLFISTFQFGYAQDNYDADLIPSALRNRANATIRNEETVVDMRSRDNVLYSVKQAITVLNKNGDENARLVLFYDKNTAIKSIKGEVFNEFGKLTHKFSHGDFKDESAVQGFSLFEDNRVKHFLPAVNSYPYTVVYTYEIRFKQNLNIPNWIPKPSSDVAVEKSTYTFICKPTDTVNIKTQNIAKAEEKLDDKQKVLIWQANNLVGEKDEPYSPLADTYQTYVKIAPQQFSYYNYKGSYANWQELGKWYYDNLLKDRDELPIQTINSIKELVKEEKTDKDKARKIYQYLQEKTRYISIQVGIGGYQPFKAIEVDKTGYGDCKALVNYMKSLLSVAGIESYYCVVQAGTQKKSLDPSFASMNQGNHIILCMPLKGDTTWLECTDQKIPFGFLSDFTDDRYVLACTDNGGKLLKTPKYTAATNLQLRNAILTIAKNGDINGKVTTKFSGAQYDNHLELVDKSAIEQKKSLKDYYNLNNINFSTASYQLDKSIIPTITEDLNINIRGYCSVSENKIFIVLNAFNVKSAVPEVRNRRMPIYLNRGYTDIDSIEYILPENIIPFIEPISKEIKTNFGSYMINATVKNNKLIYYRKFVLNEGTYPAADYEQFFKFINDVNISDTLKLIFSLKK